MVTSTQLQNYKKLCSTTKQGEGQRTLSKNRRSWLTKPCHFVPKKIKITTNHLALNHIRFATFKSTKSMLGARNKVLLDSTTLNNNGIQIHGRLVPHFFTTITNATPTRNSYDDYTLNKIYAYNFDQISNSCK
jgi:hypothetical protein